MTTPSERTLALRSHMDMCARRMADHACMPTDYPTFKPEERLSWLTCLAREYRHALHLWQESWAKDILETSETYERTDPDAVTQPGIPCLNP